MVIYHGSSNIIKRPIYGKGNPNNDYGLGFYCTENIELAKEWSCTNMKFNGYSNCYEIDLNKYKILDLRKEDYTVLNWIAILLNFRSFDTNSLIANQAKEYLIKNFYINIDEYDVIIGYRADDSYFTFAKDFINNNISVEQLSIALKLGDLGDQIVFKSKRVIDALKFLDYKVANSGEYYIKRINRDKRARELYLNKYRNELSIDGLYVLDIMRKELKHGDKII